MKFRQLLLEKTHDLFGHLEMIGLKTGRRVKHSHGAWFREILQ
jgi:hypothetical protein